MKRLLPSVFLLLSALLVKSQLRFDNIDSLKLLLNASNQDTFKVRLCADLSFTYAFLQVDSSIKYGQQAVSLARRIGDKNGEAAGMFVYGWALWASGNYDKAIEAALESLNFYKNVKNYVRQIDGYSALAVFYRDAGDYGQALRYGIQAKNLYDSLVLTHELHGVDPFVTLASIYLFTDQVDSATFYINKQYELEEKGKPVSGYTLDVLGGIEGKKKNYSRALAYFHAAIATANLNKNYLDIVFTYDFIAQLYQETGRMDSSLWYAKGIINNASFSIFPNAVLGALTILARNYRLMNNSDSALKYLELRETLNDSLFNKSKARAIQVLTFNETLKQQVKEAEQVQYQNKVKLYAVLALSGLFLLIGIVLYWNNKAKQKANVLLHQQKLKVETALTALEAAQSQLVQSEKMASLGELTAGIAHEIQNPLNFVNNFAEVNQELISEMKEELGSGHLDNVREIATQIGVNEEKIMHHGKRADAIVKSMLQHSRTHAGTKQSTDINGLTDEYLRLSYHGFRAKDHSFKVNFKTNYDQTIGDIQIIPQDIGKILLNLFNNAYYTVSEKMQQRHANYEPCISVSTKGGRDQVEIRVKDNGNGIPKDLMDKIFQPFFTTKPTGQGTGLGLSLSYDIIKAHGGRIEVKSAETEGSEFLVLIPVG